MPKCKTLLERLDGENVKKITIPLPLPRRITYEKEDVHDRFIRYLGNIVLKALKLDRAILEILALDVSEIEKDKERILDYLSSREDLKNYDFSVTNKGNLLYIAFEKRENYQG